MHKFRLRYSKYHRMLESVTRRPHPPGELPALLKRLQKSSSEEKLATIADDAGLVEDAHESHKQREWFETGPDAAARDRVVREAYRCLAQELLDDWRPVKMLWLEGGDEFDVVVDYRGREINYILITPGDTSRFDDHFVELPEERTMHLFADEGEVKNYKPMMKREANTDPQP